MSGLSGPEFFLDGRLLITAAIYLGVTFLYSKDKQAEREIEETTPLKIVTNNIKCFGVTLTQQVKYLYDKNFKPLKKESKENFRR